MVDDDPHGKLYCLNVYTSDLRDPSWMPAGSARTLRMLEGLPRALPLAAAADKLAAHPQLVARRLLGEVPIAEDGSFNIEVPANIPLELQVLDQRGLAMRSCGWVWTRNHFNQGCVGCHEDGELTPDNTLVAALRQPSLALFPQSELRASVAFDRDVLPIVAAKCVPCHGPQGSPPVLQTGAAAGSVAGLPGPARCAGASGSRLGLGFLCASGPGARTSPLVWHILGQNTSRPWDGPWASRPAKPIPSEPPIVLTQAECQTLIRWIDLGAAFDAGHAAPAAQPLGDARLPADRPDATESRP